MPSPPDGMAPPVVPPCMAKRWLPVQHTSCGTATFLHELPHDTPQQLSAVLGGELMVGSMVQAAPAACLAALQDSRCGNSILGPAARQQQQEAVADGTGVLVLHLAPLRSWAAACSWGACFSRLLCACLAPRCAVVQWSLRHDARGVDCLVFSSLPEQRAWAVLDQQQQHADGCSGARAPIPRSNGVQQCLEQRDQQQQQRSLLTALLQLVGRMLLAMARWLLGCSTISSSRPCPGCLWPPVLVTVTGAYTVAGLEDVDGEGSPTQSLVTAIIKADLGGWLSGPPQQQQQQQQQQQHGSDALWTLAVWSGVVDALLQQLTSGVEGAKAELSGQQQSPGSRQQQQQQHPPSAGAAVTFTGRRQASGASRCGRSSPLNAAALVQALLAVVGSLADSVLTPLAAWQAPQQQQQQRQSWWAAAFGAAARPAAAARPGSFLGRSGSSSLSTGDAALPDAAAALVGRDSTGQPLTGFCDPAFWSPLHEPGWPQPFHVRGPTYLTDRAKVPAGTCAFTLLAVNLVSTSEAVHHIARFLPSVRRARAASCFAINLMVPTAADVLNLVMVFGSARPFPAPAAAPPAAPPHGSDGGASGSSGSEGASSSSSSSGDSGFVHALQRFLAAGDSDRSHALKLIPRIQVGPWVLQQAVGTTPVIVGRKLETSFHCTDRYLEIDIDVTTCKAASFIVQSIRGMTSSLVIDLAFLLEGRRPDELPEALLGAVRFANLDMGATTRLAVDAAEGAEEVPPWPAPWTAGA